jgi:hypothetical protein
MLPMRPSTAHAAPARGASPPAAQRPPPLSPQNPYIRRPARHLPANAKASSVFSSAGGGHAHAPHRHLTALRDFNSSEVAAIRADLRAGQTLDQYLRHERVLEHFLANTWTLPLASAIEETMLATLKAREVIYWQDIPSLHVLYSRKCAQVLPHSKGLVGFTFFSREVLVTQLPSAHAAFSPEHDGKIFATPDPAMIIPLWDSNGNICGVVEVIRDSKRPSFDKEDTAFVEFFIRKFKVYSPWLFQPKRVDSLCLELLQSMDFEQFLISLQRKLCEFFNCTSVELWRYSISEASATQYLRSPTVFDLSISATGERDLERLFSLRFQKLRFLHSEIVRTRRKVSLSNPVLFLRNYRERECREKMDIEL